MNTLVKVLRNDYSLNFVNKVYSMITGLLSSIFLTRYLGVIYKGDYSYVLQIVSLFSIVLSLGIHQSYTYFYKKNNGRIFQKYVNFYFLQLILNIIIAVVLSIILKENLLIIYACLLFPFHIIKQELAGTIAAENIRLGIKIQMLNSTIKMFSFLILFLVAKSNVLFPILILTLIDINTIFLYLYFMKTTPNLKDNKFRFISKVIKFSWLPMLTSLLLTLNYSVDVILLKNMGSPIELGLYSTAIGIVNYFWLIPDAFKEVLVSRVARNTSTEKILLTLKSSTLSVVIVILLFAIFGQFAITILYGSEFSQSYLVTLILSVGAVSMVFYKIIGVVLLAEGKRWFYFMSLLISVVVNIIGNIITIPIIGMYGAALSSILSYSICGLSFLFYFIWYKELKFRDVFLVNLSEIKVLHNILKRR